MAETQYEPEKKPKFTTIDSYIASFPEEVQVVLQKLREVIKSAAPGATEKISYGMPTFFWHGNLVHFAMYKKHIGFYPTPSPIEFFSDRLAAYKTSKGAVQFPFDAPLPFGLISEMVEFRVREMNERTIAK